MADFDEWIRELDEDVIQADYGYEDGEFTVYPEHWRPMFNEGITPAQAFKRALDAFSAACAEADLAHAANWARIKAEDAAAIAKEDRPMTLDKPGEGAELTMADVAMGNAMEIGRLLLVQTRLGNALAKLVDACYAADEREELAEEIDGSLLDEAEAAIALIDRFKPPRAAEAALRPGGGE